MRALLRRVESARPLPESFQFGKVRVDFLRGECLRAGREVKLTPKELAMLRIFAERPGEVITRDEFLDRVWGYGSYPVTRTVDNHILRLRTKLEDDPARPQHLLTANKAGYRLGNLRPT